MVHRFSDASRAGNARNRFDRGLSRHEGRTEWESALFSSSESSEIGAFGVMKMIQKLKELFAPVDFQGISLEEIARALADQEIRTIWLLRLMDDLKQMNLEIDRRLLSGQEFKIIDLCARRRAYQDVLEGVLSAQRIKPKDARHNPLVSGAFPDLDRVTA